MVLKTGINILLAALIVLVVFATGVSVGISMQDRFAEPSAGTPLEERSPEDNPLPTAVPESPISEQPSNKDEGGCFMQNCHGAEIICGEKGPLMCTMEYRIGDACRKYASCVKSDGVCAVKKSPEFDRCINCVLQCGQNGAMNGVSMGMQNSFDCESQCLNRVLNAGEGSDQGGRTLGVQSPVFVEMTP